MMIAIIPFTVDSIRKFRVPLIEQAKEEETKKNDMPITYWGIYFDGKHVSHTSSKELAEKTKLWMEKWLKDKL
jgi:hypothetical protein